MWHGAGRRSPRASPELPLPPRLRWSLIHQQPGQLCLGLAPEGPDCLVGSTENCVAFLKASYGLSVVSSCPAESRMGWGSLNRAARSAGGFIILKKIIGPHGPIPYFIHRVRVQLKGFYRYYRIVPQSARGFSGLAPQTARESRPKLLVDKVICSKGLSTSTLGRHGIGGAVETELSGALG